MSQTLVVLHLRAQGLGEGDEHPPTLSCGVWSTLPYLTYVCQCHSCHKIVIIKQVAASTYPPVQHMPVPHLTVTLTIPPPILTYAIRLSQKSNSFVYGLRAFFPLNFVKMLNRLQTISDACMTGFTMSEVTAVSTLCAYHFPAVMDKWTHVALISPDQRDKMVSTMHTA